MMKIFGAEDGGIFLGGEMSQPRTFETVEMSCVEQGRTARLLVEWTQPREGRQIVAVECDNPRFASLVPWECGWSCWDKVASRER